MAQSIVIRFYFIAKTFFTKNLTFLKGVDFYSDYEYSANLKVKNSKNLIDVNFNNGC